MLIHQISEVRSLNLTKYHLYLNTEDQLHSLCSITDPLDGVMLIGYGAPFSFALIDTYPKVRY